MADNKLKKLIELHQEAANCGVCFKKYKNLKNNVVVKGAQPRSIGENYFSQEIRVCLILINPGSGDTKSDGGWGDYLTPFKEAETLKEREDTWDEVQNFIKREEPKWGMIKGNWEKLYYQSLGLSKSEIAMVNIMMCAEDDNNYKSEPTLNECFFEQKKSQKIIKALKPDKIVLSGGKPIEFFCKDSFSKISLTELRKRRDQRMDRILESQGEDGLKNTDFQKIPKFQLRDNIKNEFPDSDFYWIGHYAARNNTLAKHFDAAVEDAKIFSNTSLRIITSDEN